MTDSAIVRGVMRAIDWIRPFAIATAATQSFAEAIHMAERRRGRPLPSLVKLHQTVRAAVTADLRVANGAAARAAPRPPPK